RAVLHVLVELYEGSGIEQRRDALAGRHLAAGVLLRSCCGVAVAHGFLVLAAVVGDAARGGGERRGCVCRCGRRLLRGGCCCGGVLFGHACQPSAGPQRMVHEHLQLIREFVVDLPLGTLRFSHAESRIAASSSRSTAIRDSALRVGGGGVPGEREAIPWNPWN